MRSSGLLAKGGGGRLLRPGQVQDPGAEAGEQGVEGGGVEGLGVVAAGGGRRRPGQGGPGGGQVTVVAGQPGQLRPAEGAGGLLQELSVQSPEEPAAGAGLDPVVQPAQELALAAGVGHHQPVPGRADPGPGCGQLGPADRDLRRGQVPEDGSLSPGSTSTSWGTMPSGSGGTPRWGSRAGSTVASTGRPWSRAARSCRSAVAGPLVRRTWNGTPSRARAASAGSRLCTNGLMRPPRYRLVSCSYSNTK